MTEYAITRKLNHYRKQLMLLYRGANEHLLEEILATAPIYIQERYTYDNWNGGQYGHALTFYLQDEVYGKIGGFEEIEKLSSRIKSDFNQASASIENEGIAAVFIELFDQEDAECQAAIQPNGVVSLNGEHVSLWRSGYLKLFISHRDKHKQAAHALAGLLLPYGISCFVAHDNIEPTEKWRHEIEKALRSMDAFLALLTDDFSGGNWTNQEVGFAIARGVPIIPLKVSSLNPYGFMEIYQGLPGDFENMSQTAQKVFKLICQKLDGRNIVKRATISAFVNSTSYMDSMAAFERLKDIPQFTDDELDHLAHGFNKNSQLNGCIVITSKNQFFNFLQLRSNNSYKKVDWKIERNVSDIPF
jgi:hypothetical protein